MMKVIRFLWITFFINLINIHAQTQEVVSFSQSYIPYELGIEFNGWHYFTASDSSGIELWKTKGDSAYFVEDFHSGTYFDSFLNISFPYSSFPSGFIEYNGELYFTINSNAINTRELVKMDTNELYTVIASPPLTSSIIGNLKVFNNKLYYFENGLQGTILFAYDGAVHDTILTLPTVNTYSFGNTLSYPFPFEKTLFEFQNQLVFGYSECDTCHGYLYFYDGLSFTQGPQYFENLQITPPNLYQSKLEVFQNELYFIWNDSSSRKIHHFDGLSSSAIPFNGNVRNELISYDNRLFFNGNDGVVGYELWSYDGLNCQLIDDVHIGPSTAAGYYGPTGFEIFNDLMFFTQSDVSNNFELWLYDGDSIVFFQELNLGYQAGVDRGRGFKKVGEHLYFSGDNGTGLNRLWRIADCELENIIEDSISACVEYILPNGLLVDTSGTYYDTTYGICIIDTAINYHVTHVTILPLDISTEVDNFTISAIHSNATYQWLNCTNLTEIVGETNQTFSPENNGNYAVVIIDNNTGCSDTSTCVTISGLNFQTENRLEVDIYPNPSQGQFHIGGIADYSDIQVEVYNMLGQNVPIRTNQTADGYDVSLLAASGLYIVKVKTHEACFEQILLLEY